MIFRFSRRRNRSESSSSLVVPARVCVDDEKPRAAYKIEDLGQTSRYPRSIYCPIVHMPMTDPVMASDGFSYERAAIYEWLTRKHTSPVTGAKLTHLFLTPNHTLRNTISELVMEGASTDGAAPGTS